MRERGAGDRARLLSLDMVRREPEGRGSSGAPSSGTPIGPLGCDERIAALVRSVVGGTVLVPDLRAGVQEFHERGMNSVTPEGDRVTASGALLGGRDAPSLGLVQRTTELRRLTEEMSSLADAVEAARTAASDAAEASRESSEEVRRLRAEIADHAADHSRRSEALARVDKERRQVGEALETLDTEIEEMRTLRSESEQAVGVVAQRVATLEAERSSLEEQAEEAGRGYLAVDGERKVAAERRMDARVALAEARSLATAARQRVDRAKDEIRGLEERATAYDEEAVELQSRIRVCRGRRHRGRGPRPSGRGGSAAAPAMGSWRRAPRSTNSSTAPAVRPSGTA